MGRKSSKAKYEQNIVTPVVRGDLVFMAGYEEPTIAVRVTRSGDSFAAAPAWTTKSVGFFMCSPVPAGDCLYGVTQGKKGALACVGMADGKVRWTTEGGLGEYASIVSLGELLLVVTGKGDLLFVAADPAAYREIARVEGLGDGVWSHIAVADGALFIKDRTTVARYPLELGGRGPLPK